MVHIKHIKKHSLTLILDSKNDFTIQKIWKHAKKFKWWIITKIVYFKITLKNVLKSSQTLSGIIKSVWSCCIYFLPKKFNEIGRTSTTTKNFYYKKTPPSQNMDILIPKTLSTNKHTQTTPKNSYNEQK